MEGPLSIDLGSGGKQTTVHQKQIYISEANIHFHIYFPDVCCLPWVGVVNRHMYIRSKRTLPKKRRFSTSLCLILEVNRRAYQL